jgi:GTP-binding protein Era
MAHRAGTAVIVGRPNVGKSTLLNALVGQKVAIVTPRPQTTRTRIVGIRTLPEAQLVLIDTPGLHQARSLLNRRMVDVARSTLAEADVAILVVDAAAGVKAGD